MTSRPFGFTHDGSALNPGEAAEIVTAAHALLSGTPLPVIAANMRRRGVTTAATARWTAVGVGRMLRRARNAGLAEHAGFIIGPAHGPAVLPVPTWCAVLSRVHDPGRTLLSPLAAQCLGAGLYECYCGATVRVFVAAGATPGARYTCRLTKHWTRPAPPVDALIWHAVTERLTQQATLRRLRRTAATPGSIPGICGDIDTVIASAQRATDDWINRYVRGDVSADQLAARAAELHHQVNRLRTGYGDPVAAVARLLADHPGSWQTLSHTDKRALIHLMCRVQIQPIGQGRRRGWTPGQSYMDPQSIHIQWHL